jgi:putative tryptophan/tyrosine transport system substrate-binding protein
MSASRVLTRAGALVSYGNNVADGYRRAGLYAARLLQGAQPRDLPIDQATSFELVINLTNAKALGINTPPTLLAQADDVLE